MTSTRNALGRGINALIPNARPPAHVAAADPRELRESGEPTGQIPVAQIDLIP